MGTIPMIGPVLSPSRAKVLKICVRSYSKEVHPKRVDMNTSMVNTRLGQDLFDQGFLNLNFLCHYLYLSSN